MDPIPSSVLILGGLGHVTLLTVHLCLKKQDEGRQGGSAPCSQGWEECCTPGAAGTTPAGWNGLCSLASAACHCISTSIFALPSDGGPERMEQPARMQLGSCHTGKLFPSGRFGSCCVHQRQELGVAQWHKDWGFLLPHLNFTVVAVHAATDGNAVLSGLLTLTKLLVIWLQQKPKANWSW